MLSALWHCKEVFKGTSAKLISTVHDEILIECDAQSVNLVGYGLKECMTRGYLDVFPNGITRDLVEIGAGKSWASAKSKENKLTLD